MKHKKHRDQQSARLDINHRGFITSVHRIKKIQSYVWGRATKKYVAHCASQCWQKLPKLAAKARIDIDTLRREKTRFDSFEGPVPLSYLRAIGVDIEILKKCEQIDRIEYCDVDVLPWFPRMYERQSEPDSIKSMFPEYITKLHYALAYLWREAETSSEPCQYVLTWPQIKTISVCSGTPPHLEITTRRPTLWRNDKLLEESDDEGEAMPESDMLEFRPVDIGVFENAALQHLEPRTSETATYCNPQPVFDRVCKRFDIANEISHEQHAIYEPVVMILDHYDPMLIVAHWRRARGNWSSEIGFREYEGEAARLCLQMPDGLSIEDSAAFIYALFDAQDWGEAWGFDKRNRAVSLKMAQEISNARRCYRGERPVRFDPVTHPQPYSVPHVAIAVE